MASLSLSRQERRGATASAASLQETDWLDPLHAAEVESPLREKREIFLGCGSGFACLEGFDTEVDSSVSARIQSANWKKKIRLFCMECFFFHF